MKHRILTVLRTGCRAIVVNAADCFALPICLTILNFETGGFPWNGQSLCAGTPDPLHGRVMERRDSHVPGLAVPPSIPKDFDPCGGPLELINKIGNGIACVFVLGEAALTAQYSSANIPANAQLSGVDHTLDIRLCSFGCPAPVVYVGVAPRALIVITPPSFVQVNTSRSSPAGRRPTAFALHSTPI